MSNNKLREQQKVTVEQYFMNKVAQNVAAMPEVISESNARRLTAYLVIKANSTLEENNKSWEDVDINKFAMDCVKTATLGLDASNDEVYPIPYNNERTGKLDLQCTPSAKGLRKLVMQYAIGEPITSFRCFTVREGDRFYLKRTPGNDLWEFEENVFSDGKPIGWVTIVTREDGTSEVMTHTKKDIDKRRAASKAPNSPAWTNWYNEMAEAKAIRRHATRIRFELPDKQAEALEELEKQETEENMKDVTPEPQYIELTGEPISEEEAEQIENQEEEGKQKKEVKPKPTSAKNAKEGEQTTIDLSWMEA